MYNSPAARWHIPLNKTEVTLAHDIGKSLAFKSNVTGGYEIDARIGDNANGCSDVHIFKKVAGKQMMKVDFFTAKQIDRLLILFIETYLKISKTNKPTFN